MDEMENKKKRRMKHGEGVRYKGMGFLRKENFRSGNLWDRLRQAHWLRWSKHLKKSFPATMKLVGHLEHDHADFQLGYGLSPHLGKECS